MMFLSRGTQTSVRNALSTPSRCFSFSSSDASRALLASRKSATVSGPFCSRAAMPSPTLPSEWTPSIAAALGFRLTASPPAYFFRESNGNLFQDDAPAIPFTQHTARWTPDTFRSKQKLADEQKLLIQTDLRGGQIQEAEAEVHGDILLLSEAIGDVVLRQPLAFWTQWMAHMLCKCTFDSGSTHVFRADTWKLPVVMRGKVVGSSDGVQVRRVQIRRRHEEYRYGLHFLHAMVVKPAAELRADLDDADDEKERVLISRLFERDTRLDREAAGDPRTTVKPQGPHEEEDLDCLELKPGVELNLNEPKPELFCEALSVALSNLQQLESIADVPVPGVCRDKSSPDRPAEDAPPLYLMLVNGTQLAFLRFCVKDTLLRGIRDKGYQSLKINESHLQSFLHGQKGKAAEGVSALSFDQMRRRASRLLGFTPAFHVPETSVQQLMMPGDRLWFDVRQVDDRLVIARALASIKSCAEGLMLQHDTTTQAALEAQVLTSPTKKIARASV